MRLHKILMRHYAPKDSKEAVKAIVLVNDEAQILPRLENTRAAIGHTFSYGAWAERSEERGQLEIYDDDYKVIGHETYLERMARLRGEYNDEDADVEDAYYGVTHYGWDEGKEISDAEAEMLLGLGLVEDWREPLEAVQ